MSKKEYETRKLKLSPKITYRDRNHWGWKHHLKLYQILKNINIEIDAAKPPEEEDRHWALR